MCFLVVPNRFRCTEAANDDTRFPLLLWDPPQEFVCNSCMFEECAPPIPVSILLGHSGIGDAVESVKTAASDDIQDNNVPGRLFDVALCRCLNMIYCIYFNDID